MQIIGLRLMIEATGTAPRPRLVAKAEGPVMPLRTVSVWHGGCWQDADLYARRSLLAGHRFRGPAIVEQDDCTTCIPAGFEVHIDQYGNMIINDSLIGAA